MGTERVEMKVSALISKHNSAQDDIDLGLWLKLRGDIRKLVEALPEHLSVWVD